MKWPKEKGETMIWNNFNKVRSKLKIGNRARKTKCTNRIAKIGYGYIGLWEKRTLLLFYNSCLCDPHFETVISNEHRKIKIYTFNVSFITMFILVVFDTSSVSLTLPYFWQLNDNVHRHTDNSLCLILMVCSAPA